eukprot:gene5636-10857_t
MLIDNNLLYATLVTVKPVSSVTSWKQRDVLLGKSLKHRIYYFASACDICLCKTPMLGLNEPAWKSASFLWLSALRLAVSHTFLYNKLDGYERDHLGDIEEKISKEGEMMKNSISSSYSGRKLIIDHFNFSSEPHQMTAENQEKVVNWVFAEMIYENENDTSGMQKVKTKLHGYAPCNDSVNPVEFVEQGVVGDQLTVECGVSCLFQLENCVTEKERLDGLYLEVADFHAGLKFLQTSTTETFNKHRFETRSTTW